MINKLCEKQRMETKTKVRSLKMKKRMRSKTRRKNESTSMRTAQRREESKLREGMAAMKEHW